VVAGRDRRDRVPELLEETDAGHHQLHLDHSNRVVEDPQDWPSLGGFTDDGGQVKAQPLEECEGVGMGRRTYNGILILRHRPTR
jgi:hypothetical protein